MTDAILQLQLNLLPTASSGTTALVLQQRIIL